MVQFRYFEVLPIVHQNPKSLKEVQVKLSIIKKDNNGDILIGVPCRTSTEWIGQIDSLIKNLEAIKAEGSIQLKTQDIPL